MNVVRLGHRHSFSSSQSLYSSSRHCNCHPSSRRHDTRLAVILRSDNILTTGSAGPTDKAPMRGDAKNRGNQYLYFSTCLLNTNPSIRWLFSKHSFNLRILDVAWKALHPWIELVCSLCAHKRIHATVLLYLFTAAHLAIWPAVLVSCNKPRIHQTGPDWCKVSLELGCRLKYWGWRRLDILSAA